MPKFMQHASNWYFDVMLLIFLSRLLCYPTGILHVHLCLASAAVHARSPKSALDVTTEQIYASRGSNGGQQVDLVLAGDEASDYINFVVKDSSSGTWYDQGGTNYHIPLTGSVATMSIDEQIPDAELPDLPGELCGIWSYIKWEQAGCPNRTEDQSQAAYREAIEVTLSLT